MYTQSLALGIIQSVCRRHLETTQACALLSKLAPTNAGRKRVSDRQFEFLIPLTNLEETDDSYSDEDPAKYVKICLQSTILGSGRVKDRIVYMYVAMQ